MTKSILIIDDSRTTRGMIKRCLKMSGLVFEEVHEAENGRDGLEQLRDHTIDLVFTDLNMPEMTGFEFIDQLASEGTLPGMPLIVISTEGSVQRRQELQEKGIRRFIEKPFSPDQIREAVEDVLKGLEQ